MKYVQTWKNIWRTKRRNSDLKYWNRIAKDYAECVEMSEYCYGKKIREILKKEGIISKNSAVLDIGAGPGSVTIPLAECVRKVVAVEPADEMVKYLLANASKKGLRNIEIIKKRWEDVNIAEIESLFDLAVCSDVLQLFQDVDNQLLRIAITSEYCCVAMSLNSEFEDLYDNLGLRIRKCKYSDFECLLNIIRSMGWRPSVEVIDVVMKRSANSAMKTWELFLAMYKKISEKDREIIRDFVLSKSRKGVYEGKVRMAIMWWEL